MKTRTDLLNFLAEKYNLQRYLEIGVQVPELNFDRVKCNDKVGVDPDLNTGATFQITSDDFFSAVTRYSGKNAGPMDTHEAKMLSRGPFVMNEDYVKKTISFGIKFDLIFIDGLHTAEQVKKDFENSLKVLSPNGFIVLHDCNPLKEEHTIVPRPTERGHWNGDVYRFAVSILKKHTIDIDNGCLIWRNTSDQRDAVVALNIKPIPWGTFDKNRKVLLNLISWDEFISAHSHV